MVHISTCTRLQIYFLNYFKFLNCICKCNHLVQSKKKIEAAHEKLEQDLDIKNILNKLNLVYKNYEMANKLQKMKENDIDNNLHERDKRRSDRSEQ